MLKPKSTIHHLTRTSTPLTDDTLLMGTNGNETNAISLEEVKEYLGPTGTTDAIPLSEKGQPNGVPTLGSNGKIPSSQLPAISGGGGGGGGIKVIEYDPSQNVEVVYTVAGTVFVPTRPNTVDDIPTSSWNPTTGVMGVANATQTNGFSGNSAEYVGLKLTPSLYNMRGSFTIDSSLCEDAWGFALLQYQPQGTFPIDLWLYLTNQHYTMVEDTDLSQPQTFGWFLTHTDEYFQQLWVTDPSSSIYERSESNPIDTKPQGVYTCNIGTFIEAYMEFTRLSHEQVLEVLSTNFSPEQMATVLKKTFVYSIELQLMLEIKPNTPYLHFFMNAYHRAGQTDTHLLDPTSQLTITYDLQQVANTVPAEAVDGDFLHLLGNAKIFDKSLTKGSFVQLYDNTSKMIVHANQP